jgi:hypothetical protein
MKNHSPGTGDQVSKTCDSIKKDEILPPIQRVNLRLSLLKTQQKTYTLEMISKNWK